jgi:hypothetical protein
VDVTVLADVLNLNLKKCKNIIDVDSLGGVDILNLSSCENINYIFTPREI